MKLLIATGLYAPDIGGPATYTAMLEQELPGRGYELSVVPFRSVRKYPKIIRHVVYFFRVWRQARQVDIVYALDPVSVGLPALLAARLRRKTFLLRLGGDYAWEQGRQRFGMEETLDDYAARPQAAPLPVRLLAQLQSFVANQAATVVAPSEYLKSIIVGWGVRSDRVRVVYSALSVLHPTLDQNTAQKTYDAGSPTIVTSGRLVPWKGIAEVIAALDRLRETYPNITLLVAGDGPQQAALMQQAENSDVTVRFLGRLSKDELANVKKAADVYVLNTAYEGLSHDLLETMDLEIPIVTTTAGGNVELLRHNQTALLVQFDDAMALARSIEACITDTEATRHRVVAAKKDTARFAQDKVLAELESLLKSYE